jgi:hypothetical protein
MPRWPAHPPGATHSGAHATARVKMRSPTTCLCAALLALSAGPLACAAKHDDDSRKAAPGKPERAPAPVRGAAGDEDLRVMLAQIASARACEQIRGHFHALAADGQPQLMTGALWIHGCRSSSRGTEVKFQLAGNGWQWIDEQKRKVGAKFSLRQYVRFAVTATITGTLDVGYDPDRHVASVWLSTKGDPDVRFSPIGKLDVDAEGAWSSVLGAAAGLLADSPEESAKQDAQNQGAAAFKQQLGAGLTVTIDLCTGVTRSALGHSPRGKMAPAGVGESKGIDVELQPGGLMIFGPQPASAGMTIAAEVPSGSARLALVCNDEAEVEAKAFLAGAASPEGLAATPAANKSILTAGDVSGKATLHTDPVRCPVSLLARLSPTAREPVRLNWRRPANESAESSAALIDCR